MELPSIYAKIKKRSARVRMVIAGAGPREAELRQTLPDAIFLGWIDHDRLPPIYSAADMLVLPSKFDTFGCVVLEALSCGLPVAAYDTKGPKDIIEHERCGYLAKNQANLIAYISSFAADNQLQRSFKRAALKRAARYSADKIVLRLVSDVGLAS